MHKLPTTAAVLLALIVPTMALDSPELAKLNLDKQIIQSRTQQEVAKCGHIKESAIFGSDNPTLQLGIAGLPKQVAAAIEDAFNRCVQAARMKGQQQIQKIQQEQEELIARYAEMERQ